MAMVGLSIEIGTLIAWEVWGVDDEPGNPGEDGVWIKICSPGAWTVEESATQGQKN